MWDQRVLHVLEEKRCGVESVEGDAVRSVQGVRSGAGVRGGAEIGYWEGFGRGGGKYSFRSSSCSFLGIISSM